jgi:ribosomal protein S27AE
MKERKFELETDGMLPLVRPTSCPNCGGKMNHGILRIPGRIDAHVFIELDAPDYDDERHQPLDVWVCGDCGYVELHTLPSKEYVNRS